MNLLVTGKRSGMNSLVGKYVQRNPNGRLCKVLEVKGTRVKVMDYGFWTGWITWKTFEKKWRVLAE